MPISPKEAQDRYSESVWETLKQILARHNFVLTRHEFMIISAEPLPEYAITFIKLKLGDANYGNVKYNRDHKRVDWDDPIFEVVYFPGKSEDFKLTDVESSYMASILNQIDNVLSGNVRTIDIDFIIRTYGTKEMRNRALFEIKREYKKLGWNVSEYDEEDDNGNTKKMFKFFY